MHNLKIATFGDEYAYLGGFDMLNGVKWRSLASDIW